jgi:hypothetical protein
MPQVEFESTIPVFEGEKTVHALNGSATVIGQSNDLTNQIKNQHNSHETNQSPE